MLQNGAKVWVSSRKEENFNELKSIIPVELHSRLELFIGDPKDEQSCNKLKEEILKKDGKINHVISSVGGWWQKGKLTDQSVEQYQNDLSDMTIAHFIVFKTFAKLLAQTPNSTYIFINGSSMSSKYFIPDASLIPICSCTVHGIYIAACSEFKDNQNLAIAQFNLGVWIRKKADSNFDANTSQYEVGHDYIAKFIPKIILKHQTEVYKLTSRSEGDQLYKDL